MDDLILIKDTRNLEELERNFELYNSQSYNYRKMADDQSINLYGDDNYNRYNKIKASILQYQPKDQVAGSVANLESSSDIDTTLLDYDIKAAKTREAEEHSGCILIYLPIENYLSGDYEANLILLEKRYKQYFEQSENIRSMSDDYAFSIFNTDNQNLYYKLKAKILQDKEGDLIDNKDAESLDQYRHTVTFEMTKYPFDNILSEALSLDIETIENPQTRYNYLKDLNVALATNYAEEIPTIVPNLFPDELLDLGILNRDNFYKVNTDLSDDLFLSEYFHGIFMDSYKYKKLVEENYRKLKDDYNTYAQKLLELAWNPEVEPTKENYAKARNNMIKYINAKMESVNILNVSRYNIDENAILTETTKFDNELFPVFVVCTYTYTPMGKIIRKVTNSQFSHSAIGFDSGLQTLYSFNMVTPKKHGGLSFESIDGYIFDNNKAELFVGCVFLDRRDYERIRSNVNWYIANYEKCNYSISNLFILLANKAKTKKYQMNMICSQFVDSLFKLVNIDLTGKASNLVKPQDLRQAADNSTVYILYDGLAVNYSMSKTDKKIKSLISKIKRGKVKDDVNKTMVNPNLLAVAESSSYYSDLEIKPFFERAFPIKISKEVITIETPKDIENEYQKSHKLLIEYDKANSYEPMKKELCKLWYINTVLERKIHKPSCKDKKKLMNTRSRILNDFKKYIKVVLDVEPDFDFTLYYNESHYSDTNIKMDTQTTMELFEILKQIIKH